VRGRRARRHRGLQAIAIPLLLRGLARALRQGSRERENARTAFVWLALAHHEPHTHPPTPRSCIRLVSAGRLCETSEAVGC
jgi:hypothetical protein